MYKLAKRGLVLFMVLALMATLVVGCGEQESTEPEQQAAEETIFLNIGTGGTAGTYYPLGGAIAEILKDNIPGVNATAESTGASAANINMLNQGEIDFAFVQNDVSYYADQGIELFQEQGKIEGLKALATLYPEICQIITTGDTGITSIEEFAGKKIAVGAAGSGVEANARQILAAYGFTYEDINPQYLSFSEAAAGLKDGNIDAAFITAGTPTSAVLDLSAQNDVILLSIDAEVADQLVAEYPFYTKVTIPADVYGTASDVDTLAVKAMLVATDNMTEEMAYNITKAIYENLDKLEAAHAAGKLITLETAQEGISVPLHPGAEKYFNENS